MKLFGLVDCNNFYVSCERVFDPSLRGRAVVVLSNNDGCIVSRSDEAKALGVGMGEPVFELKQRMNCVGIVMLSSNYTLYGDMSARTMAILREMAPRLEQYSIDECFLDLSGIPIGELSDLGRRMRSRVLQWTGLPVSVGIASTRTLAKAANRAAKRDPALAGVMVLNGDDRRRALLAGMDHADVWGIGRALAGKFARMGVSNALELSSMPAEAIRRRFGVTVMRTVLELRGQACLALNDAPPAPAGIMRSRSFSRRVSRLDELCEAAGMHAARAAEKLRHYHLLAGRISVSLHTSRHEPPATRHLADLSTDLEESTDDTGILIAAAGDLVRRLYRRGYGYRKVAVMLGDLVHRDAHTPNLFGGEQRSRKRRLMSTVDRINARYGGAVRYAATGLARDWEAASAHLTPCYTTRWSDLPVVR